MQMLRMLQILHVAWSVCLCVERTGARFAKMVETIAGADPGVEIGGIYRPIIWRVRSASI